MCCTPALKCSQANFGTARPTSADVATRRRRSEVARLKKALQKKASQVEQLVASQRALLKSKSQREEELSEQATKLRQEVDQVAVQRKLVDQGRKHAEQQVEAMKQSVKSKSEELGKARQQIQMLQEERDSALQRVAAMEDTQRQHEELMSDMQTKYDAALGQLSVARMEQKQELHDLQDREDSLSSATVQYTAELARAERRRIQSESAARKAEALQREAEEQACELQRALGEQERLLAERDGVVAQLQQALDAGVAAEDSERSKLEAEARESSKRAEQAEIQLRQVEKELAASTRAAVRASSHSNTAELEEQLNKMCQDVLAKQALLQQVMSEQTALRSRLESEALRNADLQVTPHTGACTPPHHTHANVVRTQARVFSVQLLLSFDSCLTVLHERAPRTRWLDCRPPRRWCVATTASWSWGKGGCPSPWPNRFNERLKPVI